MKKFKSLSETQIGALNSYKAVTTTTYTPPSRRERDMYGIFEFDNKVYFMNVHDKERILKMAHSFEFLNKTDNYPSFFYRNKWTDLLDFIFLRDRNMTSYLFKNNDIYDLRRCNVCFRNRYNNSLVYQNRNVEFIWEWRENNEEYKCSYLPASISCTHKDIDTYITII